MYFQDLIAVSYSSLIRSKARSLLTMLGIIIGISMVILALSIGEAAQTYIINQIASFGSDLLYIESGSGDSDMPSPFTEQVLTAKDLKKLKKESWLESATGDIFQMGLISRDNFSKNINVIGTNPEELDIYGYSLLSGSFITKDDMDSHSKVVVIGRDLQDLLFPNENPINKKIKINKTNYRIIGVLNKIGTQMFLNYDEMAFLPATTVMDKYHIDRYSYFTLKSSIDINEAKTRAQELFRDLHNIDSDQDDVRITTQEEAIKMVSKITDILKILLSSIAGISLLVGGIGIMNIMYVSVTERTKEIGLRKAIGATSQEILNQFLVESIFLTFLGGVGGVLFGIFLDWLGIQIITFYQEGWVFTISLSGIILGITISTTVGIFFGYFPAKKASQLNPIEAMRSNE